jgi:hypothetical protein
VADAARVAAGLAAATRPAAALGVAAISTRPAAVLGVAAAAFVAGTFLPSEALGQASQIRGYYLHAFAAMESSPFSEAGVMDVQRLRLMTAPRWGPFTFDVAYEHTLTLRSDDLALGRGFEGMEPAAPWLRLQGTLVDRRRVTWAHGLDRLSASARLGERTRLTLGRQTVSWATALYFTPTDPFVPFDPADPFREYRAGIDAVRAEVFLGPFTEVDAVLRPAEAVDGSETLTALVRGQTLLRGWQVSGWAGAIHEEPAVAAGATGTVGDTGFRLEGGLRREDGSTVVRGSVGADRLFRVRDRDLHAVVEYQHDGFGAGRAAELVPTALSASAARGELLVLGRDAVVTNATYDLRALTNVGLLALLNARDGSILLSPTVVHSLADEAALRVGGFAGLGPGADGATLRSEHGATPLVGFAAVSLFF